MTALLDFPKAKPPGLDAGFRRRGNIIVFAVPWAAEAHLVAPEGARERGNTENRWVAFPIQPSGLVERYQMEKAVGSFLVRI